jgi:hypothetical protein
MDPVLGFLAVEGKEDAHLPVTNNILSNYT